MQIEKMFFKEFQKKIKIKNVQLQTWIFQWPFMKGKWQRQGECHKFVEMWILASVGYRSCRVNLIYFVSVVSQYLLLFAMEESEEKSADSVELLLFISWGLICTIFKFKGFFDPLVVQVYVQLYFLN